MLQTYEGYWDDGRILPIGSPIKIAGRRKVLITVLEEEPKKPLSIEEKLARCVEIDRMTEESSEEKLNIEDFPRVSFGREPIIFSDEG
jgi:hypothetical protein